MICYICMGWAILPFMKQTIDVLTMPGFVLLLLGGIAYTVGAVLYGIGKKKDPVFHTVFHLFVVLGSVLQQIMPLSGAALSEMHRFISISTTLMEGGLASACDWAILLWVIPAVERVPRVLNSLKPLLEEYPLSLGALQA